MNMKRIAGTLVGVLAALTLLGGCGGSMKARDVELKNAFLVKPEIYEKGTDDQSLYRYRKPNVDIKRYREILVEPVIIVKQAELDQNQLENYQKLANNAYSYLVSELEKDYHLTNKPGPGILRLQFAIIDADSSKPVRNLLSSATPVGIGMNAVKYGATGKQTGVGEITVELKFTDSVSGELLGAALDRRVGGKNPKGIIDSWYNADQALKYWAEQLRYVMCMERAGSDCEKP